MKEEEEGLYLKKNVEPQRFAYMDPNRINQIFNTFSTKKTYAAGLLDLALMTSNFAQIKQLLNMSKLAPWNALQITLFVCVCVSLFLQILCGILLVFLSKQTEFLDDEKREKVIRSNNSVTILIFIVVILNIFINVFISID